MRRRTLRMPSFDYSSPGAYFVTICVHERACLLGDVAGEQARLSEIGALVLWTWECLPDRFPTIELDAFVVMPNHVHGILWLTDHRVVVGLAQPSAIDTEVGEASLATTSFVSITTPSHKRPSLGQVIGSFKSLTTIEANKRQGTPGQRLWQPDYYERVVRSETELHRFRQHIADNPARWDSDPEHPSSSTRHQ
jgi:putative transposase